MKISNQNTYLETGIKIIPAGDDTAVSPLPPLRNPLFNRIDSNIPPEDGLRLGYGIVPNILPHCMKDCYDWSLRPREFFSVVLENEHLKATFLPGIGGRLWSLFDKDENRNLITENPVYKPGNFAVRNSWASGGIEFNFGSRGHDAYTASPIFASVLQDADGTPVLRMYEFCRVRAVTYQMDFFLPSGSHFLYNRVRLVNPNNREVPFYYWSNMAIDEHKKQRIVVPAETSYANHYVNDAVHSLAKLPLPIAENDFDATYPMNHPVSKDHFFNIPKEERKYEAVINEDGRGFLHTSTDRLQGRKLFVWGMNTGGRNWQRRLTVPEGNSYVEIQGGICKTQMECIPFPANTTWEWLEAYGSVKAAPSKVFGDWKEAREEVGSRLNDLLKRPDLEAMLERTRKDIALKPGTVIHQGSGWGALENARRAAAKQPLLDAQLDFGSPDELQAPWIDLVTKGFFPVQNDNTMMSSYMVQDEFYDLLKEAEKKDTSSASNWNLLLHIGINAFYRKDFETARTYFEKSISASASAIGYFALACTARVLKDKPAIAPNLLAAISMAPTCISLAKEAFRILLEQQEYDTIADLYNHYGESVKNVPMVRFLYTCSIANSGDWRTAKNMLEEPLLHDVPDIREGENSYTDLYLKIKECESKEFNLPFDPRQIDIPEEFDLRMSAVTLPKNQKKWSL